MSVTNAQYSRDIAEKAIRIVQLEATLQDALDSIDQALEMVNTNALALLKADDKIAELERELTKEDPAYCSVCGSCGDTGCCGELRCKYVNSHHADIAEGNKILNSMCSEKDERIAQLEAQLAGARTALELLLSGPTIKQQEDGVDINEVARAALS